MFEEGKVVWSMATLRIISSSIEFTAAMLMLHYGKVSTALRINGVLGVIGPVLLLVVSALGLAGIVSTIPTFRVVLLLIAMILIFIATR